MTLKSYLIKINYKFEIKEKMKLCKPLFEIWNQPAGLEGVYKQIEKVGRVCYKSEDKITEDSAKPFVDRMIKSGHGAMLEHGTVYLQYETVKSAINPLTKYHLNKYSKVKAKEGATEETMKLFVTTNLRVLVENDWLDDLQYICEPTEYHERRVTVHFTADAGVMREFFRHRVFSMAQESTRYCNYLRDKFSNSITVIYPSWLKEEEELEFEEDMRVIEELYFKWLNKGWTAQQARVFLPLGVKAEAVMTGFTSDFKHFFDLRARGTTGAPHPQAKELAEPLMKEFIARKYINN